MTRSSIFAINETSERRYYHGWINGVIRLYFYLHEGLGQVNNFKNVILAIAALAVMMRIEKQYFTVALMGLACIPLLILLGYLWVRRGKMSTEYFSIRYTSPFGRYTIEMQERQMELLENIEKHLDTLTKHNS